MGTGTPGIHNSILGTETSKFYAKPHVYIIELFTHYKGGNFNIYIWAWFGYVTCLRREIRFYLQFDDEIISCLGRAKVRAFNKNPNHIHTEFTCINP